MTLVREPGSEILAQFVVPTRGTWLNTSISDVPLDAVYDGRNIFVREGKLRRRPALEQFSYTIPASPTPSFSTFILGGVAITTDAGSTISTPYIYAASRNRLYIFADTGPSSAWSSYPVTGALTSNNETAIDIAFITTGIATYVLFAIASPLPGGIVPLKAFAIPGGGSVATLPGTNIPNASSVCISSSRVIALTRTDTIVWSRILDPTTFDPLAIAIRSQTADKGICVRSLSALSFVLYKEQSIHLARAQAGLDEGAAFSFFEPIIVEGPAGIYSVVDVNGMHFYMTKSGRVAIFDGTNYPSWIADGIWFYLQEDINQEYAYLIRGVYDYRLNVVTFFYPRGNETSSMTGMVIINLPFPGFQAQEGITPFCFLGVSGKAITHANNRRLPKELDRAIVYTVPNTSPADTTYGNYLSETATTDNGTAFTCTFQTGLQSAPDARHVQTTIENFLERGVGYGSVSVAPVTSNTLETPTGTIHTADAQTIDLTAIPVNEFIGFNKKTRFFGFQYTWPSASTLRYSGTVAYDSVKRRK